MNDLASGNWRIEQVLDGDKTKFSALDITQGERVELLSIQQTSPGSWQMKSFHGPDGSLSTADTAEAEDWARKAADITLRELLNQRVSPHPPTPPSSTFYE